MSRWLETLTTKSPKKGAIHLVKRKIKKKKGINHKKGASHFNFSAKNYF
jgi:hypothetical protein